MKFLKRTPWWYKLLQSYKEESDKEWKESEIGKTNGRISAPRTRKVHTINAKWNDVIEF